MDYIGDALQKAIARRLNGGGTEEEMVKQIVTEGRGSLMSKAQAGLEANDLAWENTMIRLTAAQTSPTSPIWLSREKSYLAVQKGWQDIIDSIKAKP